MRLLRSIGALLALLLMAPSAWSQVALVPSDSITGAQSGGANIVVTVPTNLVAGDCWGVIIGTDADVGVTLDNHADFDEVSASIAPASGWAGRAYYRVATGGEGNKTFTFTGGAIFQVRWYSMRFTGCRSGAYNGNVNTIQPNSANIDAPDITIQDTNNLAVLWIFDGTNDDTALAVPSGTTIRANLHSNFSNLAVATQASLSAGSYAPSAWTNVGVDPAWAQTFEIRISAGGGGGSAPQRSLLGVGQ